jgi:FAD/FMN-containing dehydrogenase
MNRPTAKGQTIGRQDPRFEAALLGTSFNAQDPGRRPDLIVQANDIDDVIAAVKRAQDEGHKIGICSGGHSWAQNHIRDGGLMLDLSRMNGIAINEADGTAMIGPGCLAGELNEALAKRRLFFPVAHNAASSSPWRMLTPSAWAGFFYKAALAGTAEPMALPART